MGEGEEGEGEEESFAEEVEHSEEDAWTESELACQELAQQAADAWNVNHDRQEGMRLNAQALEAIKVRGWTDGGRGCGSDAQCAPPVAGVT